MWNRILLALVVVFATGCGGSLVSALTEGSLRSETDKCAALKPWPAPRLASVLAPLRTQMDSGKTGLYVLEEGMGSIIARGWLADNAQKSIDVQYFIFSADAVGMIAADALLLAAERGVKVRLIVDDVLHDGDAAFLAAMDAHPNFEIRVYNPTINIGKSLPGKIVSAIKDFRGVNQRMHNKTFVVDGEVVITGGRNIADEYFDLHPDYNFRDRDILMLAGAVTQVTASFEQFWEHRLSVPLQRLVKAPSRSKDVWDQLHRFACDPERYWPEVRRRVRAVPKQFAALQRKGLLRWVEGVRFVSDAPGKNDGKSGLGGGGLSTSALIDLVRSAKREVIIQTPYLVTTKLGKGLFAETVKRGVRLVILTNSLASTDSFPSFAGYVSDRLELLSIGVELYEYKPYGPMRAKLMTLPPGKDIPKRTIFGLHAKSMVVDGETIMVGTFNLDPRSANLNTECVVIAKDRPLAQRMRKLLVRELQPDCSWRITPKFNPDSEAPCSFKWKMFWAKPIPKALL